jgi:hypothetical protein
MHVYQSLPNTSSYNGVRFITADTFSAPRERGLQQQKQVDEAAAADNTLKSHYRMAGADILIRTSPARLDEGIKYET